MSRLDRALSGSLDAALPRSALVTNNVSDMSGANVGGDGVAFTPRVSETGADTYEAALRIRDGDRSANLSVLVERYASVPTDLQCRSAEMLTDATSMGVVIVRCDLVEPSLLSLDQLALKTYDPNLTGAWLTARPAHTSRPSQTIGIGHTASGCVETNPSER